MKLSLTLIIFTLLTINAFAQPHRVEHFVRVLGQEETEIRAFGIVSGLTGTGDDVKNYSPLANAILTQLSRSGMFAGTDVRAISSTRNSALVEVVVRIPAAGARSGERLDCTVYSIGNARSLAGGILSMTALSIPLQQDENALVLGMASGRIAVEQSPTVGRIVNGCRLTSDSMNQYIHQGLITLVIKSEHARPNMARIIAEAINENPNFRTLSQQPAVAINAHSVAIPVPPTVFGERFPPNNFLEILLESELRDVPRRVPRVMINERTGTIAIDPDVEVRPTLVTHQNFIAEIPPVLEAGEEEEVPQQFLGIDTDTKFRQMNGENVTNMKLLALRASLNELRATPQEVIDIIKILHQQGAIVGEVVFVD